MIRINWSAMAGRLICVLALLIVLQISGAKAQSLFEGQVIDSAKQVAVASVTVSLIGQKLATLTNNQGYFKITTENIVTNDTMSFSSVGYLTYKVSVSNYKTNSIVILRSSNVSLEQVDIINRELKLMRLNPFGLFLLVRDTLYVPSPYTANSSYAKLFKAPEDNAIVTKIELGRTYFGLFPLEKLTAKDAVEPLTPLTKSNPKTRFLIHILTANPQSKLPDKVLFTKTISIEDNLNWITVDLSRESVVIKSKEFFIAIEWLRIPYNEVVKLEWIPRVRTTKKNGTELYEDISRYRILYQPALVCYKNNYVTPSYIKNKYGEWVPSMNEKEVALSATIKY